MWGSLLGLLVGVANLIATAWRPLAEDSASILLSLAALALTSWGAIGFCAARRQQRWLDGILAVFSAATLTMAVSQVANFIRVLTFYDGAAAQP